MSGYPGGMSEQTRNRLWFARHTEAIPERVLNEFVDWVGSTEPVTDWHWSRDLDAAVISKLWARFAAKRKKDS